MCARTPCTGSTQPVISATVELPSVERKRRCRRPGRRSRRRSWCGRAQPRQHRRPSRPGTPTPSFTMASTSQLAGELLVAHEDGLGQIAERRAGGLLAAALPDGAGAGLLCFAWRLSKPFEIELPPLASRAASTMKSSGRPKVFVEMEGLLAGETLAFRVLRSRPGQSPIFSTRSNCFSSASITLATRSAESFSSGYAPCHQVAHGIDHLDREMAAPGRAGGHGECRGAEFCAAHSRGLRSTAARRR